MILKNKKKLCVCIFVGIFICLSCRIWWVNKNARIPEIEIFRQGETVEYNGVGYTIENATMMEYNAFFEKYPEYKSYYNSSDYGRRMLLVECVADKLSDDSEMSISDVLSALTELEMFSVIEMHSGKRYTLKLI